MTGPIPSTSASRLPVAATVAPISAVDRFEALVRGPDLGDQVAGQRFRVVSTAPAGRTPATAGTPTRRSDQLRRRPGSGP